MRKIRTLQAKKERRQRPETLKKGQLEKKGKEGREAYKKDRGKRATESS